RLQIFESIGAGLGAADDRLPTRLSRDAENLNHIAASHQICIDPERRRLLRLQKAEEFVTAGKRRVEDIDAESLLAKMRTQVENPQRRVGLHDLPLFGIFKEEVA